MSHQVESTTTQSNNISVALGVLGMFFLFLFGFLATTQSTVSTGGNEQVAIVPTELPSSTPVPPTATFTSQPSPTPIPPTATFTAQPSPTSVPPTAVVEPTVEEVADAGTAYDPALVAQGQQLFASCAGCHGLDAHGIPGLGKDLVNSEFVHSLSDDDLLTFIKTGRPIWDPMNTTGIDMPARGGNPMLSDDDLLAIIAYVRSLSAEGN